MKWAHTINTMSMILDEPIKMISYEEFLAEAIAIKNSNQAAILIQKFLTKKLGKKVYRMPGVEEFKNSYGHGYGLRFFYDKNKSIRINWVAMSLKSTAITSVDVWDGTSRDPSFNIQFDREVSLAITLPFLADLLVGRVTTIKPGAYAAIPVDDLTSVINEEFNDEEGEILNEMYNDAYEQVVDKFLEPGKPIATSSMSHRQSKVLDTLRDLNPGMFSGGGRGNKLVFAGNTHDLDTLRSDAKKNETVHKLGGAVATIKTGASNETYVADKETESMDKNIERIAYEDQIKHLSSLIKLVVRGAYNALFIAGRGGVGKTHTVEQNLSDLGLRDGDGYFKNTGTSSPRGLYGLLYKYRDKVILFDDSDGTVADQDARNILKAATDTKKERKLVWNKVSSMLKDPDEITDADLENGILPTYFEFTGKIIFISNLSINKLDPDGALRTRAAMISIDPSDEEVLNFMEKICTKIPLNDGLDLPEEARKEVVDMLRSSPNKSDLNLRKLVRGLNVRAALGEGSDDWKVIVRLYA